MANNEDDDENIPILNDVLRPGDGAPASRSGEPSETDGEHTDSPLTATEIETIAHRAIEQHTEHLQAAITRAIHHAIDAKNHERQSGDHDADGNQD